MDALNPVNAFDYKFLGSVKSFAAEKNYGMIECAESASIWGQDVYAHKTVLDSANLGVGDTVRFGVHVNPRGQPQASFPVYKVGEDGAPIGVKENEIVKNAEEYAAIDPGFLVKLGEELAKRSKSQNENRGKKRAFEQVGGGGAGGDPMMAMFKMMATLLGKKGASKGDSTAVAEPAKGKGKTGGFGGHCLPKTRISEAPFAGTVTSWKGKYGWIECVEPIEHPKAKNHGGGLFFSKDAINGSDTIEVGAGVTFHIYEDDSGLGAEEVDVVVPASG